MGWKGAVAAAALAVLAGCDAADYKATANRNDANAALAIAAADDFLGRPTDLEKLAAMPAIQEALDRQAGMAQQGVLQRLRDPTSPLWGDMWTVDYVAFCGTVNGKNAFGAYGGAKRFVAFGEGGATIEDDQTFAEEWKRCEGARRPVVPAPAAAG